MWVFKLKLAFQRNIYHSFTALKRLKETLSYLDNSLEGFMALLVSSTLGQVSSYAHVLPEEDLAVLLQPVQHLGQKSSINILPLLLFNLLFSPASLLSSFFCFCFVPFVQRFSFLFFYIHRYCQSCCSHLFDILLEEPERKALVQFDLLGVPLALQLSVVREDLVNHGEHVAGTFLVVRRRVRRLGRRTRLLHEKGQRLGRNVLFFLLGIFDKYPAKICFIRYSEGHLKT